MAISTKPKIKLKTKVMITISGAGGIVAGRSEFVDEAPQYFVRYLNKQGDACQGWFGEGELTAEGDAPADEE